MAAEWSTELLYIFETTFFFRWKYDRKTIVRECPVSLAICPAKNREPDSLWKMTRMYVANLEITQLNYHDFYWQSEAKILIRTFCKPRSRRRWGIGERKDSTIRTIALHVRFKALFISLTSSVEQQRNNHFFFRACGWEPRRRILSVWNPTLPTYVMLKLR